MKHVLALLCTALPAALMAAEIDITAGAGHLDNASPVSEPSSIGISISSGQDSGLRFGGSFRAADYGNADIRERRIGAGISYRMPLSGRVFWEPQLDVAHIDMEHSGDSARLTWREGNATAASAGLRLGYRASALSFSVSLSHQFANVNLDAADLASTCIMNCTGIGNVVYDPYAGLDTEGASRETEDALESSTWLQASLGFAF